MLGLRIVKPKHEIVDVCGRCGLGVYIDDEVCRICVGCAKLTVWCECEEMPLQKVTMSEKILRGFYAGTIGEFASKVSSMHSKAIVNRTRVESSGITMLKCRFSYHVKTHSLSTGLSCV